MNSDGAFNETTFLPAFAAAHPCENLADHPGSVLVLGILSSVYQVNAYFKLLLGK